MFDMEERTILGIEYFIDGHDGDLVRSILIARISIISDFVDGLDDSGVRMDQQFDHTGFAIGRSGQLVSNIARPDLFVRISLDHDTPGVVDVLDSFEVTVCPIRKSGGIVGEFVSSIFLINGDLFTIAFVNGRITQTIDGDRVCITRTACVVVQIF